MTACDTKTDGPRVALIGIDGGDWDILDPMIERGHLPNLAKVRHDGCTARLIIDSPQSPNSWTSIATGHHPEEHGIQQGNSGVGGSFSAGQDQVKKHRIWDMTSRWGRSALVVNYWVTGPAYAINGVMLAREGDSTFPPGADARRTRDIAPNVHADLIKTLGVGLLRSGSMLDQLHSDTDFDLLVLPFYGHDQSLHMLYSEWSANQNPELLAGLDPTRRSQIQTGFEIVEETARLGDTMLGWAMDYVGEDGYIVLFSDHGHTRASPNERRVAVNRSLLDGRRGTIEAGTVTVGDTTLTVSHAFWWPSPNPLNYRMRVPRLTLTGDDDGSVKAALLAKTTANGVQIFQEHGAGLAVTQSVIDICDTTLGKYESPEFSCFVNSGSHGLEDLGIFGVYGPGVVAGKTQVDVETVDVTPTALWLMGLPTGADLAGSPITPCLSSPHKVEQIPTYETGKRPWTVEAPEFRDDVELQEWLKSMGYMD